MSSPNTPLPRKIKFSHPPSVALKKGHYNNYDVAAIDFLSLFHRIDIGGRDNSITQVAADHLIKRTTLSDRYHAWVKGGRENSDVADGVTDGRGGHNRIFTEGEEHALAGFIRGTYLAIGSPLHDSDIARLATEKWHSLPRSHGVAAPSFAASHQWVTTFKHRWGFSSKSPQMRKHLVEPVSSDIDQQFVNDLRAALSRVGASLVFNIDEQCIRDVTIQGTVIGNTGPDRAQVKFNGESEKGLTVINCIVADGFVLQAACVKKGKTEKCLVSLHMDKLPITMIGYHSSHGFITPDILIRYIKQVVQPRVNGRPFVLLLDQYAAHTDDSVITFLDQINCHVLWIPGGRSGTRQPADISFHGVIRTVMAEEWRIERLNEPFSEPTHADALRYYAAGRAKVTAHCVQRGFAEAADWKELSAAILNLEPQPSASSSSSLSSSPSYFKWSPNKPPVTPPRRKRNEKEALRPKSATTKKNKHSSTTSSLSSSSQPAKSSTTVSSDHKYGSDTKETKNERSRDDVMYSSEMGCVDPFAFPCTTSSKPSSSSSHHQQASSSTTRTSTTGNNSINQAASSLLAMSGTRHSSERRQTKHD